MLSNDHDLSQKNKKLASLTDWVILTLTLALYLLWMLRDDVPLPGLLLLGALWLASMFTSGFLENLSPMHPTILAFILLLPVNYLFSPSPQLTLVKIYGLILSFSLFFVIIRLVNFRRNIPLLVIALVALALLGAALLGLFATDFPDRGLGFIMRFGQMLPRISSVLPGADINKNTMGGALAFFPPLLVSLLWDAGAYKRMLARYPRLKKVPVSLYKPLILIVLGLVLLALLLTQSRGAWLGTAVGIFAVLVWKDKRFLIAIPVGIAFLFVVISRTGDGTLGGFIAFLDQGQDSSIPSRLQIWAKVIHLIRGFPLTGIGLDALGQVYPVYFNSFLFPEYSSTLFHAHNTLLSVALEMGLPALILYVALLTSFTLMAKRAWKHARTINRVLMMGLVCGMLAHQIFGIMDAYTMGKSLGVIMWIYYAIMSALFVHRGQMIRSKLEENHPDPELPKAARIRYVLIGLAGWLLFDFVALSLSQVNIYASIGLALASGVALGWILNHTHRFFFRSEQSHDLLNKS